MLGGAGQGTIVPETFRNQGTGMVHTSFRRFRSQGAARAHQVLQGVSRNRIRFARWDEGGGFVTSQRSHPGRSSSASGPRLLGPRARKLAGRAPSCPRSPGALEGAGPRGGGSDEDPRPLVTGPAGWGSSRSLRTGPRCYCSCGEPWSRTRRARRATPAPGRWGR